MNFRGVFLFVFIISIIIPLVSADTNQTTDKVSKAYQCLQNSVNNKTSSQLSLQEAAFSILALGNNDKSKQKLDSENNTVNSNQTCFPRSSCTIKDTAQALLAYKELNRNTDKIENYLISKKASATGLHWFLEIDIENHQPASCTIKYPGNDQTISIGEDMKISGSPGSCLSIVQSEYWLEISQSCLDTTFEISCSGDFSGSFITTLLYQQESSETLFISPNTHSAPSSGTTSESIQSKCLKTSAECDYEGTLWAAVALDQAGKDIASFIPYLNAFTLNHESLFPSAFLYKLTSGQDHYTNLVQSQRNSQYWNAPTSPYNKFYDTALAMFSLQGTSALELTNAKTYLLNVQDSTGCWNNNNLRDTAFLLYSGWPDSSSTGGTGTGTGTGGTTELCESASPAYSCESSILACEDAGGDYLQNYDCLGSLICCSIALQEQTCSSLNGDICTASEDCSGRTISSVEGSCCVEGSCSARSTNTINECEDAGNICQSSCASDQTETTDLCTDNGDVCCADKTTSSSGISTWIWIFLILIVLVVLAIVFRRRLQMFMFRRKSNSNSMSSNSSSIPIHRPPFPPSSPMQPRSPQLLHRQPTQADKEMEETLRKLRDMGK